jgi:hypothetical protein
LETRASAKPILLVLHRMVFSRSVKPLRSFKRRSEQRSHSTRLLSS